MHNFRRYAGPATLAATLGVLSLIGLAGAQDYPTPGVQVQYGSGAITRASRIKFTGATGSCTGGTCTVPVTGAGGGAPASRILTAGTGLTGGGDLSADRTFNVGAGDGVSVAADAVAVDSTVIRTTGDQSMAGAKTFTGSFVLPATASPAQTVDGSAVWDSDDNLLTVGTGSTRKTMIAQGVNTLPLGSGGVEFRQAAFSATEKVFSVRKYDDDLWLWVDDGGTHINERDLTLEAGTRLVSPASSAGVYILPCGGQSTSSSAFDCWASVIAAKGKIGAPGLSGGASQINGGDGGDGSAALAASGDGGPVFVIGGADGTPGAGGAHSRSGEVLIDAGANFGGGTTGSVFIGAVDDDGWDPAPYAARVVLGAASTPVQIGANKTAFSGSTGVVTKYNSETAAGVGLPYLEKVGQDVASSGAGVQSTTIATYTPLATGTYRVSIVVSCTTTDTITTAITYTDAVNTTAQTLTPISGVVLGANATTSSTTIVRANTSTALVAKITISAQSTTKASAIIERLN